MTTVHLCAALLALASLDSRTFREGVLRFEPIDPRNGVAFAAHGSARVLVEPSGVTLRPHTAPGRDIRLHFPGGATAAKLAAELPLPGVSSYFLGRDRERWRTSVAGFGRVRLGSVYPGVDVVLYGRGRDLELDLELAPGADPGLVRLALDGVEGLEMAGGDVVGRFPGGEMRLHAPVAWQPRGEERRPVAAHLVVHGDREVRLAVGAIDPTLPLVVDPIVTFATYLGGSGVEAAVDVAVDPQGHIYLLGETDSIDLPGAGGGLSGGRDAFVSKIKPPHVLPRTSDYHLVYTVYLGGSGDEYVQDLYMPRKAGGLAVGSDGRACVTGVTRSTDFPGATGTGAGAADGFVAKIEADGSGLVFGAYLGGSNEDYPRGLAVDSAGNPVVVGWTYSGNFPVTAGAFRTTASVNFSSFDGFVAKLSGTTGAIQWATYLGADLANDGAADVAVDSADEVTVVGQTASDSFPVKNAFQASRAGGWDAFVSRLDAGGSALVWSSYFGGSLDETPHGVAVDHQRNAYITGLTASAGLATPSAWDATNNGGDAFVARVFSTGALSYATYLGGHQLDEAYGIAVNGNREASVTGWTYSDMPMTFPQVLPIQATSGGGNHEAFVTTLDAAGSSLLFSSTFGGNWDDQGIGIAADSGANLFIVGFTTSTNLRTADPTDGTLDGAGDSFLMVVGPPAADVGDLFALIFHLLRDGPRPPGAECNGDTAVNIADVFCHIGRLLGPPPPPPPPS